MRRSGPSSEAERMSRLRRLAVLAVALVACIRPAIQATAVGPIEVLKAD